MGISRDSMHKRRATGGKKKAWRKKRKYELGRQPANTKLSSNKTVRRIRVRGVSVLQMDPAAGIEAEYHHKNNRVYCWKGLRLAARQDLEGFSKFTDNGIEGVVPLELLPPDVRSKYQAKPADRSKRGKKEDAKNTAHQVEENQIATPATDMDGEGIRTDTTVTAMDFDAATLPGTQDGTTTPDELQKLSSDTDIGQEAGQLDADDAEGEAGIIDGETDDVDLDAVA